MVKLSAKPSNYIKDVKRNKIQLMPENWKKYSLGDLSEDISYGYTESASKEEIGPKFLRITDIQNDFINWNEVPYCKISEKDLIKYQVEIGDIVVARTGNSTGATSMIKNQINAVYASYLIRYRLNKKIAVPGFIDFVLRSNSWKNYVDAIKGGSAQPGANAKQFAAFEINVPPLQEQKAIASILSALDDKIELNLEMNKTLEKMAMALYKHWFVDFGPFQEGEFVDTELGEIPKGWEVKQLEDLLEIKYGKDHKKLKEGNIPVYGSGGIMRYVDTFLYDQESILIPRKGTLSNLFYLSEPFWSVDTMFYSKFRKQNFGKYIFYFLKSLDLASMDVGSAVPSLTTELLKRIKILVPSIQEVEKFNEIVSGYFEVMESNKDENQTLTQLRDTLLPKLISGEVRVKDIEKTLSEVL